MPKVRGIGGVFFKSKDPKALYAWYEEHLGIKAKPGEGVTFPWQSPEGQSGEDLTAWSIFPDETKYFKESRSSFMINYIVEDLDGLLETLKASGVSVDDARESYDFGSFGWITDLDGNRIELWEPKFPATEGS